MDDRSRSGGRRVPIIGIAGGIGSGKSAVARALGELGCLVYDADEAVRETLKEDEVKRTLASWWGGSVIDTGGEVDRRAVAKIVFDAPEERARLEGLIHPRIHDIREEIIARAEAQGAAGVVIDAPLLFEVGLDAGCDAVVFVDVPMEVRAERVRSRGWDPRELARREAAQIGLEEKRSRSDVVVPNTGDPRGLVELLRPILEQIRDAHARSA